MSCGGAAPLAGLYGKLPSRGDFVRRRLPSSFVTPWDRWLQDGMAESERALGKRWLTLYLTSPLWRFSLSAGLCGDLVAAGVLMPSVDAVGRYFPLTLAALLPAGLPAFVPAACRDDWFARLEEIALAALDAQVDPERLETALDDLGGPVQPRPLCEGPTQGARRSPEGSLRWEIASDMLGTLARDVYPSILDHMARTNLGAYSVWWTLGSDDVAPTFLVYPGLPPAEDFCSLLTDRTAGDAHVEGAGGSGTPVLSESGDS